MKRSRRDGRLGRWWSVDPECFRYTSISPYSAFGNNPVLFVDLNGKALYVIFKGVPNFDLKQFVAQLEATTGLKLKVEIKGTQAKISLLDASNIITSGSNAGFAALTHTIVKEENYLSPNSVVVVIGGDSDFPKYNMYGMSPKATVRLSPQLSKHIHGGFFAFVMGHEFQEQINANKNYPAMYNDAHDPVLQEDAKFLKTICNGCAFDAESPLKDTWAGNEEIYNDGNGVVLQKSWASYEDVNGNVLKINIHLKANYIENGFEKTYEDNAEYLKATWQYKASGAESFSEETDIK